MDLDEGGPLSKPVIAGQRVSFHGWPIANHAQLPSQLGLESPADVTQLEAQRHHIAIAEETLQMGTSAPALGRSPPLVSTPPVRLPKPG